MLAFSLSRPQDFNYDELFSINIAPGYMHYFSKGSYRVGMILPLAGALPAGILMVLQFTPISAGNSSPSTASTATSSFFYYS